MGIWTRECWVQAIFPLRWTSGRSASRLLLAALFVALVSIQPAQAGCDPRDLADAVVVSLETTAVCEPVCEDKYRCYAAAILGGALTVVANREGQDRVDGFCGTVQGQGNAVIAQVQDVLQYQFVKDQLGEISGYLSTYAQDGQQVLAIVKCGCETERLNIKNQTSFGVCANEMLHTVGCGSIDFTTGVIESCTPGGKLIQDFFNASWGGMKSIGCDSNLTSWLFNCGGGGTAGPSNIQCYDGYQPDMTGVCHLCTQTANALALGNGRCGCEAAYTPRFRFHSGLPILMGCECAAPYQRAGERCLCPSNMMIKDGACVPCADYERYVPLRVVNGVEQLPSCQSCEFGHLQSSTDPTMCVPGWPCDEKSGAVPDPETYGKTCLQCEVRQRVVADEPLYRYRCEDCAKGQKASPDHARCVPECPAGSITNTAMGAVMFGKAPAACTQCAAGEHAVYDQPGSSIGRCELMSNISLPLAKKDCGEVGPNFINDPGRPRRCLSCPDGTQPNATRSACVDIPVPRVRQPILNDNIPQRERVRDQRQDLQPNLLTPRKACPPNTKFDSRDARCVPLDAQLQDLNS